MESRRSSASGELLKQDTTADFLKQELYIANAFASTTNFTIPIPDQESKASILSSNSIVVEFLKLIEMITSLERQAAADSSIITRVTLKGLRMLFEDVRSRARTTDARHFFHLRCTVNCFYHAGLIYSCRALLKDRQRLEKGEKEERDRQLTVSTTELFQIFDFGGPSKPMLAQDLVWPLFIAGTEATRKCDQDLVVKKLQQAMLATGFTNCQHALYFLKELWQIRASHPPLQAFDWIEFAKEWTRQGRVFFVF